MSTMPSKITGDSVLCSTVCWGSDPIRHQSSASLAFVRGIHRSQRASNAENVSIWWGHHYQRPITKPSLTPASLWVRQYPYSLAECKFGCRICAYLAAPTKLKCGVLKEPVNIIFELLTLLSLWLCSSLALYNRTDSRFAPSQWEMSLQSNAVSYWLGADLESASLYVLTMMPHFIFMVLLISI